MRFSSLNREQEDFVTGVFFSFFEDNITPNLKLLGAGKGGRAYLWKKKAVKLSKGGDGSDIWLRWCIKNQGNPFVPKIHFFLQHKSGCPYVCVMEKLRPVGNGCETRSWETREYVEALDFKPHYAFWMCRNAAYLYKEWLAASKRPEFAAVVKKLKRVGLKHLDLHTGNYYWRGRGKDKQIVIVDPIYLRVGYP